MASAEEWLMMAVCDIVDLNDDPIAGMIRSPDGPFKSAWGSAHGDPRG
jgi:hypothetical protein